MFYRFAIILLKIILFIVNGKAEFQGKENLPKDKNYILVGPHRTWWDPLYLMIGASPKVFCIMGKKELFKNPILRWILVHVNVFPVDRQNPGPSAVKKPIRALKNTDMSLMMFPSGTRYSTELKGGAAFISKMAKVPIVPATYQGPLTLKDLFKRKKVIIRFGEPIDTSDVPKLDKPGMAEIDHRMQQAFGDLDKKVNPNFIYIPPEKKQ